MNETLYKFDYPRSIIREYNNWVILLRPAQVTLGALILGHKGNAIRFSEVGSDAMNELDPIIRSIESTLTKCFAYDKINYQMLMMVDPHVHFHVIPRYASARAYDTVEFIDSGWPGLPDLSKDHELTDSTKTHLLNYLTTEWV